MLSEIWSHSPAVRPRSVGVVHLRRTTCHAMSGRGDNQIGFRTVECKCLIIFHGLEKGIYSPLTVECNLFIKKSTCLTQSSLGPCVVQIWPRNARHFALETSHQRNPRSSPCVKDAGQPPVLYTSESRQVRVQTVEYKHCIKSQFATHNQLQGFSWCEFGLVTLDISRQRTPRSPPCGRTRGSLLSSTPSSRERSSSPVLLSGLELSDTIVMSLEHEPASEPVKEGPCPVQVYLAHKKQPTPPKTTIGPWA